MIIKRRRRDEESLPAEAPPSKKPTIRNTAFVFDDETRPSLKMVAAACYYPKPNPLKPEGDDAHFICAERQTLGLADGVGGWASRGVDAGQYARGLMQNAASFCALNDADVDPRAVLHHAFEKTLSEGSSTACIATLTRHGTLRAVNVGDSGFMIFRKNRLAFRSPVQQRRFNAPYQLGRLKKLDKPDCCVELEIDVEGGDVVVFGTDGVFDNMFGREIESYVRISMNEDGDRMEAEKLAWMIADVALCNSQSKRRRTPFAEEAEKAGRKHAGGKIDDITVLVAYIL